MPEYETTELEVCVDCLLLIANGEISDGTDAAERCATGQRAAWGDNARHLSLGGEELGFSWRRCEGCGSGLGGDRYRAYLLVPQS